ncbi:hypothetical protein N8873_08670 [Flavobacteriaceae bacterium]|nr:hypothetical protein [Flavobacteriaceae bacterium]
MKKLLFCSFLSLSLGLSGQTMDQGDSFINVGGGLDSALIVTYEYGLFSNITIGPFLSIYKDKIKPLLRLNQRLLIRIRQAKQKPRLRFKQRLLK